MHLALVSTAASPVVDLVGAAALVTAVTNLLKPYLELWLAPTNKLHDPTIRLLAVVFGIAVVASAQAVGGGFATAQSVYEAVLNGLAIGTGSVGLYKIFTLNASNEAGPQAAALLPGSGVVFDTTPAAVEPAPASPAPETPAAT